MAYIDTTAFAMRRPRLMLQAVRYLVANSAEHQIIRACPPEARGLSMAELRGFELVMDRERRRGELGYNLAEHIAVLALLRHRGQTEQTGPSEAALR